MRQDLGERLRVSPTGTIYASEPPTHLVAAFSPSGSVSLVVGPTVLPSVCTSPDRLETAPCTAEFSGNVLICSESRISRVSPAGIASILIGSGDNPSDGVNIANASIDRPYSLAIAPDGSIYYGSGSFSCRIRVISPAGIVSTLIPNFDNRRHDDLHQFSNPCCIALDAHGNVFVALSGQHQIWRIAPDGGPVRTPATLLTFDF